MLLTIALAGCSFSPEQAIAREVSILVQDWQNMAVDPNAIQVVHTEPWGDDVIGLVSFQALRSMGQQQDCLFVYRVTHKRWQWVIGGGGGGCGPAGGAGEPIHVGTGQHASRTEGAWSSVSGTVYDPAAVAVRVTWDDGQQQEASLIQGHFIAVRSGGHDYEQVEALDSGGATIQTQKRPQPAPGKEDS